MKHIKPLHRGNLNKEDKIIQKGCGECQSSCQSACKTSCTVANQVCTQK
ncbi:MAG: six-cysteine ranthipeptide SCIFF [Tepidanaerobacteraceae bacterium]|nr:six-cysteine peptide SCIFF [Thermoanaerobacterales bacterium]